MAMDPLAALAALDELVPAVGDDGQADGEAIAEHGEELGDLVEMAGVLAIPEARRYQQRSWELLAHARGAKKARAQQSNLDKERAVRQRVEGCFSVLAAVSSNVIAGQSLLQRQPLDPIVRAKIAFKLATMPRARGQTAKGHCIRQARSGWEVSSFMMEQQLAHLQRMMMPDGAAARHDQEGAARPRHRTLMVTFQWDETSQRLKPILGRCLPASRTNRSQAGAQIMVLSGGMHVSEAVPALHAEASQHKLTVHPWFARSLRLEAQDANFILAGILKSLPFEFDSPDSMNELMMNYDVMIISVGMDRAAANQVVVRWMCDHAYHRLQHPNLLIHVEPCALHGIALVKSRAKVSRSVAAALFSFTRWVRISKNHEALAMALYKVIESRLTVRQEARPAELRQRGEALVKALYGEFESEHFWKKNKTGEAYKTTLLTNLEDICKVHDFGSADPFVFWNSVAEGSDDHVVSGKRIGATVTRDRKEMVNRIARPMLDFLSGNAWVAATESRWTNFFRVLRRFTIVCAANRLLLEALKDVKTSLALEDSLEASLAKLVAADRNDFSSTNKLRLLRITKVLCTGNTLMSLAIMAEAQLPVERMQSKVFGADRSRPSLLDLINPAFSPIIKCQAELLELLQHFGPHDRSWQLLSALQGDFAADAIRKAARKEVLQITCGMFEMFVLRMSEVPYKLAWLTLDVVDADLQTKRKIVKEFFGTPVACLPFFCRRLREVFTTEADMLVKAPGTLRTWLLGSVVAIDFSERSHAQLRRDLMSTGQASGLAPAVDRVFCRQVAAEHVFRGGVDPAGHRLEALLPDHLRQAGAPPATRRGGSNPYQEFYHFKARALKDTHAPNRPITAEERADFDQRIKAEWQEIKSDPEERALWLDAFRARRPQPACPQPIAGAPDADAPLIPHAAVDADDGDDAAFEGIFGGKNRQWLASPSSLSDFISAHPLTSRPKVKDEEDKLFVRGPVPKRKESIHGGWGSVYGCRALYKNACEHTMPAEAVGALGMFTGRLNGWVSSLSKPDLDGGEQLLLLEGFDGENDQAKLNMAALLVGHRGRPKMQFFAECALASTKAVAWAPQAYPYELVILDKPSRMVHNSDDSVREVATCTSDELAMAALAAKPSWRFYPLKYVIPPGPCLLKMTVEGHGEEVQEKGKKCNKNDRSQGGAAERV